MTDQQRFDAALALRDKGDYPAAQDLLEQLAEVRPESSALYAVLGDTYWEQGLLDKAVNCFRRCTELTPRSETASPGLFHCLGEMGRRAEALAEADGFLHL